MRPQLRQERPRGDKLVDINVMADLCDLKGVANRDSDPDADDAFVCPRHRQDIYLTPLQHQPGLICSNRPPDLIIAGIFPSLQQTAASAQLNKSATLIKDFHLR